MESLFGKTVSPHVFNCTKKEAITGVFLWIDFVNTIFLVYFTQASVRACSTKQVFKISENLQENTCARDFFLEKVAHHQVCNVIKKRLQHRFFTVNFAKLLKALFRTPPVSASNFNSTFFLTLRPGKYNNVRSPCYDWTDLSLIRQVIHWKCHRKSEAVAQHCS